MDLKIAGKRALILGGNRGIGMGIAKALFAEGVHVAITGRDASRLGQAVLEIQSAPPASADGNVPRVHAASIDLGDTSSLRSFAERLTGEFGDIDILVNNTGGPAYGSASGRSTHDWASAFNEMVLSVITLTDSFLPGMRKRQWGRIMTVVSSGVVQPIPVLGISNTLRNSLVTWSKSLSIEIAKDGVTSNILVPGRIDTERVQITDSEVAARQGITPEEAKKQSTSIIPMGRYGSPAEFGALAAFVAGVPASYITGSVLRCDGGNIRSV